MPLCVAPVQPLNLWDRILATFDQTFRAYPLPDVDGALRALEHGLDVLKLDGVVLFSNARGIYLGDARFRPLFDELERRAAVVKPMKPVPFWPATRSNCSRGLQACRSRWIPQCPRRRYFRAALSSCCSHANATPEAPP
jgi:hypothetical protein